MSTTHFNIAQVAENVKNNLQTNETYRIPVGYIKTVSKRGGDGSDSNFTEFYKIEKIDENIDPINISNGSISQSTINSLKTYDADFVSFGNIKQSGVYPVFLLAKNGDMFVLHANSMNKMVCICIKGTLISFNDINSGTTPLFEHYEPKFKESKRNKSESSNTKESVNIVTEIDLSKF